MPSRFWRSRPFIVPLLLVLAALGTWLLHGDTLRYGFDYDDYHFLRPYTLREVVATFSGPWDLTGIEVKFYRPLTIAWYAARFKLFGLNAVAHHAVSLTLFSLVATLAGYLVYRLTARALAGVLTTLLVVCHPAMPYSLVAWVTNQMHLAQTLVVLSALLWWHMVRDRTPAWWLPLLAFATASFMIKEDGFVLLPGVVVLHAIARRVREPGLPPVSWTFLGLAAVWMTGLWWWRASALGEIGGYSRPTAYAAWINLSSGLDRVLRLVPPDRPWQTVASGFATLSTLGAFLAWRWISPAARVCLLSGLAIAVIFDLPFAFVTKAEQMYLVGIGAAIVLAGASVAIFDLAARGRHRAYAIVAAVVVAAGTASLAVVARDIARDFEPFGPIVLAHDDLVRTWGPVPPELHDYLAGKRAPGAEGHVSSNPIDELSRATFGVYGREVSPQGLPYMWMSGAIAEIYVRGSARSITIPLRHPIEAFREPTRARIEVDGRLVDDVVLDTPDWRMSVITLLPSAAPRIGGMHRIRIAIDHAWRPSDVIPGSTDERTLALQIGEAAVR